jgi:hypothetical protein
MPGGGFLLKACYAQKPLAASLLSINHDYFCTLDRWPTRTDSSELTHPAKGKRTTIFALGRQWTCGRMAVMQSVAKPDLSVTLHYCFTLSTSQVLDFRGQALVATST